MTEELFCSLLLLLTNLKSDGKAAATSPPGRLRVAAVVRGEPPGFRQRYVSVADGTFRLVDMTCFVNSI